VALGKLYKLEKEISGLTTTHPNASKFIKNMLDKSVTTTTEIDDLFELAIDVDFVDMVENIGNDTKLTKRATKQFKKVVKSPTWSDITDEIKKPNLWVTKDFLENAKGNEEEIFLITDHAEKEDETINVTNLEIGDFIIGIIDYDNIKHDKRYIMNHIIRNS